MVFHPQANARRDRRHWVTYTAGCLAAWLLSTVPIRTEAIDVEDYLKISGPTPTLTLRYGREASQFAEYFRPKGQGPFPIAILIHGGCWRSRFGGIAQFRALAETLADEGIASWNIEYRRVDEPGGGFPGTYRDIAMAVDQLVVQAAHLNIDLGHTVVIGHSAGAQLALWLAGRLTIHKASPLYSAEPFPIRSVIALGALPDLKNDAPDIMRTCGVDASMLTGHPSKTRPDVFADTSPAALLPVTAREVLINGENDTIALSRLAAQFAETARQSGSNVRALVLPGANHFDEVVTSSAAWPSINAAILKALDASTDPLK